MIPFAARRGAVDQGRFRWAAVLVALVALAVAGLASSARAEMAPEFPADPDQWINSSPLTLSALKGKAVFLWFFEEGCPTCRARWPGMLQSSDRFKDKPVVFIGVNSGSSREAIATYAKEVGCEWPILVDGTREYEKKALGSVISLSNIYQARVIRADGQIDSGNYSDVDGTVEAALVGAAWKVDPANIPESLKPAWLNIEFGNTPAAAALVKKSLTSKKPDVKAGADKLNAVIQKDIQDNLASARDLLKQRQKWPAFQIYNALAQNYRGFDLPTEATEGRKKLVADPAIKEELQALKSLDKAKKIMASQRPNSHKTVVVMLEKLVKDQPETTAGAEAKDLLKRLKPDE